MYDKFQNIQLDENVSEMPEILLIKKTFPDADKKDFHFSLILTIAGMNVNENFVYINSYKMVSMPIFCGLRPHFS